MSPRTRHVAEIAHPCGTQLPGDGSYRVDVRLSENVYVEVDGYAYHSSPQQKRYDERRRNQLRLGGKHLLVYTWWDVVHDGGRVVAELREALQRYR
jgi:very-short-patch-repair endonuclease